MSSAKSFYLSYPKPTPVNYSESMGKCVSHVAFCLRAQDEIPAVKKSLDEESLSIRKAALQALEILIGDDAKPFLITSLGDLSPGVAKESSRLINKLKLKLSSVELTDAIDIRIHPHTLVVAATAMKNSNKWERLIILLSLMELVSEEFVSDTDFIHSELVKWDAGFNRSSIQPTESQIEEIRQQYGNYAHRLSERLQWSIEFMLGDKR